MDRGFEILNHTSELKIRAAGRTKEELFLNMMRGMKEALQPKIKSKNEKSKRIVRVVSLDINTLLVDFLNEVLYLVQVHREVYRVGTFTTFSDTALQGMITGEKVDSFGDDIKAVTHHGTHVIINNEGEYTAEVIFDV